ncbi:hypothetical protein A2U01_0104003, partial [Trifolium medium]|nr:hypothetical protein [Trifolium medium]
WYGDYKNFWLFLLFGVRWGGGWSCCGVDAMGFGSSAEKGVTDFVLQVVGVGF